MRDGATRVHHGASGTGKGVQVEGDDAYGDVRGFGQFQNVGELAGLVDTAELLAAELVSNAVRHTKGPAALRVRRTVQGVVWIGAWDTDPAPPDPPRPLERMEQAGELEEGRGLGLVRACADHWGWQPSARLGDRGKYVWCQLVAA
ncbi:ATP-binding protein [Streptomyces sp. TRM68367]|uniref:ATP-binding protein n=1 Tax=Streptomyces sp. TRM68367 TaxID=2758415 RepID=UPI0021CF7BAF|nr:ATP-binding protein [Streptomyces sp. TRM68367]